MIGKELIEPFVKDCANLNGKFCNHPGNYSGQCCKEECPLIKAEDEKHG